MHSPIGLLHKLGLLFTQTDHAKLEDDCQTLLVIKQDNGTYMVDHLKGPVPFQVDWRQGLVIYTQNSCPALEAAAGKHTHLQLQPMGQ